MTATQMATAEEAPRGASSDGHGHRLARIDIFRGLAILLVILYHLDNLIILPGGWGLGRAANGAAQLPVGSLFLRFVFLPFHLGRVGVNLFFVLSGLCIHMRVARERAAQPDAPFSLSTFFLRRFYRIYPVYWAALAVGVFVVPYAYAAAFPAGSLEVVGFPTLQDVAAHAVMLHAFFKPYMMSIIRSLWSIATEEQFYLLYPLVFVLIGRRVPVTKIVLGLLALTMIWRLTLVLTNPAPATFSDGPFLVWVFGFSLPRYFEWSLGALLAWALATRRTVNAVIPGPLGSFCERHRRMLIGLGIAVILAGAGSLLRVQVKWMIEDPCYSTGWFLIIAAVLLPAAAPRRPAPTGVLASVRSWAGNRLQSLGRRSFSVYLLHEIALFITAGLMRRFHLPPIAVAAPLGCLFIWALCYPFYAYIEAPFERRSKNVGKPAPALVAAVSPGGQAA